MRHAQFRHFESLLFVIRNLLTPTPKITPFERVNISCLGHLFVIRYDNNQQVEKTHS